MMRMRKPFSLCLALALVLCCLLTQLPRAEAAEVTPVAAPMYGRNALASLDNAQALLYAYDQLVEGIAGSAAQISVYNGKNPITQEEIKLVMDAYGRDYTYHFWLGNSYSISYNSTTITKITPSYILSGTALETAKAAFNAAAEEILSGLHSGMSEYEKELYIHDRLVKQVSYVSAANAHNAYGALVEGLAVCEGYAEAFQYLLQRAGIQSFIIEGASIPPAGGSAIAHAWNAVQINGRFYQVDATWNDQGEDTYHCYFNITDAMIREDHSISAAGYALPVCSSTDAFYFNVQGGNMENPDVDTVARLMVDNCGKAHIYVPGSMDTFLNWFNDHFLEIAQAAGLTGSVSYRCNYLRHEVIMQIPQLQAHTHSYKAAVTAPTCLKDGYTTYTCACGHSYTGDPVAALGHNPGTVAGYAPGCTTEGKTDGEVCTRCAQVLKSQDVIPALEHDVVIDPYVAPTCTASGKSEGSHCGRCGQTLEAQITLPMKEHNPVLLPGEPPACLGTGLSHGYQCGDCGEILEAQEILPELGHIELLIEGKDPTCSTTGLTEGKVCQRCGVLLVPQEVIPELPHAPMTIPGKAPTCTQEGKTQGEKCSLCGEILVTQERIPSPGHEPEAVPGKAPSCTASGLTDGSICTRCGITLQPQEVLEMLPHTPVTVPGKEATCTEAGLTEGETCGICGTVTAEQTPIPATGHLWSSGSCSLCGKECQHSYPEEGGECTICGGSCPHDYLTAVVLPDCTAQGYTVYSCTLCGSEHKADYVDALGHSWKAATCTEAKTCSRCGAVQGEANGHSYGDQVVNPTCTQGGYTLHTCTACGHSYEDNPTEALGHTPGTSREENRIEPDCTNPGSCDRVVDCALCGQRLSQETMPLPPVGHSYSHSVTPPTCTDQGYTTHICSLCGHETVDSYTGAAGHSFGSWYVAEEPTCTREGRQERKCQTCGATENQTLSVLEHQWEGNLCSLCGESRNPYKLELTLGDSEGIESVWVDGEEYPVVRIPGGIRVELENADATNLVIYSFHEGGDAHSRYPEGMRVWLLHYGEEGYAAEYVPEFDNLLRYSGCSIRITGVKGIRMITSLDKALRRKLMEDNVAGLTLVEYGTAVAWAKDLEDGSPLTLGQSYVKSNHAYRRGQADPIFNETDALIQYTNVLVRFTDDQCAPDLVMRPYIILENSLGEQITLYGGQVVRSIGYIALQNRDTFPMGSEADEYVHRIIELVYGQD